LPWRRWGLMRTGVAFERKCEMTGGEPIDNGGGGV
jgi:hypothetical protein